MKTLLAVALVTATSLFCQNNKDLCTSAEDRHAEFRADNRSPFPKTLSSPITDRTLRSEDCLAARMAPPIPPAGAVSAYKLRHKVPKKALKEFAVGVHLSEVGDQIGAEEHFRQAIAIDPDYMEAHNNLASRLMDQGHLDDAIAELHVAAALDPASSTVHANLGVIYLRMKEFAKAEREARLAVALDPTAWKPQQIFGLAQRFSAEKKLTGKN